MANSYVYPGSNDVYVPSLSSDLVVEFSRNPEKFPLIEYCDYRIVDKMRGLWVNYLNDGQARVVSDSDNEWADGADSPKLLDGTSAFTFPQYNCIRRRQPKQIGHQAIDQAGWDLAATEIRFLAMQMMTKRVKRIHKTLTTQANWSYGLNLANSNYATATTASAGVTTPGAWSTTTSATGPIIRQSLAFAQIAIDQGTYGVVKAEDLYLVVNPNVAKIVALSYEFLDFVKQNPTAISIWENQSQFRRYGLPENVMGLRVVVDDTTYNSAPPGAPAVLNFTLSNSYAILMTKQKAVSPAAGGTFSTFNAFLYEDFIVEQYSDPEQRRTNFYVTESIDDSIIVAPQSGYLLKIDA
jgi:hypothetical protein